MHVPINVRRLTKTRLLGYLLVVIALAAPSILVTSAQSHAVNGDRIHIMSFVASDAIILESGGRFAFIDSGEDSEYPDGSDPRYPWRPSIRTSGAEMENRLWAYLDQLEELADGAGRDPKLEEILDLEIVQ